MNYRLEIELLSDMCPSSGEGYHRAVDVEVEHDRYGFPYLSAKRLKGCLREAALLLNEWGENIPIQGIFGDPGADGGNLVISNARLKDYESYVKTVVSRAREELVHPQNVLDAFTYIRRQTAMEEGVAKKNTLRAIRVLKRGLFFEASVSLKDGYEDALLKVCKAFRNMGFQRTRGLGEIKVSLIQEKVEGKDPEGYEKINRKPMQKEELYQLDYRIRLLEPMICKSVDRGQEMTQDFIEGSKMLGILAGWMGSEKYQRMMKAGRLYCSNLYLANGKERLQPAWASLRIPKDGEDQEIRDLTSGWEPKERMRRLTGRYVQRDGDALRHAEVKEQICYHHSRPSDKSRGRAAGEGEGEFYQLSSICEGQEFSGYLRGNGEQMEEIRRALKGKGEIRLGYGRNTEYGKVCLKLDGLNPWRDVGQTIGDKGFRVRLLSPLLMYNEQGMFSTRAEDLAKLLSKRFGGSVKVVKEQTYLDYVTVGGWQTSWKMPKPTVYGLDKGTVILLQGEKPWEKKLPAEPIFVGERTAEGYGELVLEPVPPKMGIENKSIEAMIEPEPSREENEEFVGVLEKQGEKKMLKREGRKAAKKIEAREELSPLVERMILTLKESGMKGPFYDVCESYREKNKNTRREELLCKLELWEKEVPKCCHYREKEAFEIFMRALLLETRYRIREKKAIW